MDGGVVLGEGGRDKEKTKKKEAVYEGMREGREGGGREGGGGGGGDKVDRR